MLLITRKIDVLTETTYVQNKVGASQVYSIQCYFVPLHKYLQTFFQYNIFFIYAF